jgi:hypothetical protein
MFDKLLPTLIKSFNINISPEVVKQIEQIVPQLPAKVNEVIRMNQAYWKDAQERLTRIEEQNKRILEKLGE